MKRTSVILTAILLAVLIVGGTLSAQGRNSGKHNFEGKRFQNLNLTDKQKEQIASLKSEHQKNAVDLKAEIQKLRIEIKENFAKANPDEGKIKDLTNKINDFQGKLKEAKITHWFKVYNLLDENQKKMFKNNFPKFGSNEGRGKGNCDGHGKGMRKHRNN